MRLLTLLCLIAGLQFAVPSASAVTVLSVTGVASQCNSTGGNAGNLATGIVTAKAWTQTQGYTDVNISAALDDLNTFPVAFPNFTVYLTTSVGPGTTTAREIAHATVVAPLVSPWTSNLTTLFTGLTLPAGTYYLTIYGDPNGPALGPSCWTYSNSPALTLDSGVSNIQDLQVLGVAAYPPASFFHSLSTEMLMQVTGVPLLEIQTSTLPTAVVGLPYSQQPIAGGTPPYILTITAGRLPAGLSFNTATGQISGTPTEISSSIVTFTVMDSSVPRQVASGTIILNVVPDVVAITTASLPNGAVDVPYSQTIQTIAGTAPFSWTLNRGNSLPPALTLNPATGTISGTPTTAVTNWRFAVNVTDSSQPTPQTATASYELTIVP
jgi:hypothetical protein